MTTNKRAPGGSTMRPRVAPYQIVRRSRSRMRRWIPSRDEVASIAKAIPGAPHGLDQLYRILIVDLPAQTPHQHLEYVRERVVVLVPDVSGNRSAINHLPVMKHEEFQQRELLRRQLDRLPRAPHPLAIEIDLEIRNAKSLRQRRAAAPGKRSNSRDQLAEREGLGEIVVSANFQTGHAVVHRVARGEHQYGCRDLTLSQLAAEIESAAARQHDVENDDVEAAEHRLHFPVGVVRDRNDLNASLREPGLDDGRKTWVVLDK